MHLYKIFRILASVNSYYSLSLLPPLPPVLFPVSHLLPYPSLSLQVYEESEMLEARLELLSKTNMVEGAGCIGGGGGGMDWCVRG